MKSVDTDASSHDTSVHPPSPPPPPPPPPPPQKPPASESNYHQTARQSLMAAKFAAFHKAQEAREREAEAPPTFSPCHFFFYGTLMDPDVVQSVLSLTHPLDVKKAKVLGYSIKMWGIYPALVPCEGGEVLGVACKITSFDHFIELCRYETFSYKPCFCTIILDDGTELKDSRTFVWSGKPDSSELSEGSFDLERYQKHFKQSLIRARARD